MNVSGTAPGIHIAIVRHTRAVVAARRHVDDMRALKCGDVRRLATLEHGPCAELASSTRSPAVHRTILCDTETSSYNHAHAHAHATVREAMKWGKWNVYL